MESWKLILDIVLSLSLALILGILFEKIKLGSIIGYLLAGCLLGPTFLNSVHHIESFQIAAEIGIIFLMFSIGLEFSIKHLKKIPIKQIFLGVFQISFCFALSVLLFSLFKYPIKEAIVFSAAFALSSTALVLKILTDSSLLDSARGRVIVVILLMQDLAVIPFILLIKIMAFQSSFADTLFITAKSFGKLAALFILSFLAVKGMLLFLKKSKTVSRQRDILVILSVTLCLLSAWVSHALLLPASLGPFLVGALIGDSQFRHQVSSDVSVLKTLFMTLFFTSIGLLIDFNWVKEHVVLIFEITIFLVSLKSVIIYCLGRLWLKQNSKLSTGVAFSLAHSGEFAFVIGALALQLKVINQDSFQIIVSVTLLSLLLTPILMRIGQGLASRMTAPSKQIKVFEKKGTKTIIDYPLNGHVIVVGYGPSAQAVVEELISHQVPFIVLENNHHTVEKLRAKGHPAELGDVSRMEILKHVKITQANLVVLTIPDFKNVQTAIHLIRSVNSECKIVVRSRYHSFYQDLMLAGASEVISEEMSIGKDLARASLKYCT